MTDLMIAFMQKKSVDIWVAIIHLPLAHFPLILVSIDLCNTLYLLQKGL